MKTTQRYPLIAITSLAAMLAACQPQEAEAPGEMPAAGTDAEESRDVPEPEQVNVAGPGLPAPDADAVWSHIQDNDYRRDWYLWPGKGEKYKGQQPHGMLLTTYLNDPGLDAIEYQAGEMPDGAVIVKENYTEAGALDSVTVMYKKDGYNPGHNDWFFAKYQPDGTVAKGPEGQPLAGQVPGCQDCHSQQAENDYIYTGLLEGAPGM